MKRECVYIGMFLGFIVQEGDVFARGIHSGRVRGAKTVDPAHAVAKEATSTERDIYQGFSTYSEVVSIVEQKAFRMVDFAKFMQDSLKAAVSAVDAHSAFLTQDSYSAAMESMSDKFSGIGVSIISKSLEDDALVIIDVIPGGPAAKAGMRSGDKVVEVDGAKLKGLSTDEAVAKLKGPPGSTVTLKLLRNKKPLEIKVVRDIIKDQNSLSYFFKEHNIYYLSLKLFSENVATQISDLLKIANEGKCKGIVLDLRRNPGGILQSAIEMAGLFLDKGSLVAVTKDRNHKVIDKYFTTTQPVLRTDVPIFILIDNFTASAAEILAGSLRYHSMKSYEKMGSQTGKNKPNNLLVFLLGTASFGKGSVQEVMPISNGCALKLTTMLYYLPDDLSIQATGIEPDFTIKPKFVPTDEIKWITEMYGKETSLKHHITFKEASGEKQASDKAKPKKQEESLEDQVESSLVAGVNGTGQDEEGSQELSGEKWEEKQKEALGHDIQVQAAVNMINLLDIAKKCDHRLVSSRQSALDFLKKNYLTDDKVKIEKVT